MKKLFLILISVFILVFSFQACAEQEDTRNTEYLGQFKITYYCPCRKCNGKWGAVDCYGDPLVWSTVAVDKNVIPLQTHLLIEGYDDVEFVARDTGGKWVTGNHIDMFVPVLHSEALQMQQGQKLGVWIIY